MNKNIIVRPAIEDDQPQIRRIVIEGIINPTHLNWHRFIVAESEDGNVVGCGQIKPHGDGTLELASIAVTKSYRKQGIAKKLIESLLESHGEYPLYLICRSNLESFYTPFGFQSLNKEQLPKIFKRLQKVTGFIKIVGNMKYSALFMGRNLQ